MVVTYGETDIDKLDSAVIYRSSEAGDLVIRDRKHCPVCRGTIAFYNMGEERNRWVTFTRAHLDCTRTYYDEHGELPPGFSSSFSFD